MTLKSKLLKICRYKSTELKTRTGMDRQTMIT
jgi:hypothetical protein